METFLTWAGIILFAAIGSAMFVGVIEVMILVFKNVMGQEEDE